MALFSLGFLAAQAADDYAVCFREPYSPECSALILSRHQLTPEGLELARSRIKQLADADRFRVSEGGQYTAFEMAMGCYAVGQRVPSDGGCASCLHCTQQLSIDVCDMFCPPVTEAPPPSPLTSKPSPSRDPNPREGPLTKPDKTTSIPKVPFYKQPLLLVAIVVVAFGSLVLSLALFLFLCYYGGCKKLRQYYTNWGTRRLTSLLYEYILYCVTYGYELWDLRASDSQFGFSMYVYCTV